MRATLAFAPFALLLAACGQKDAPAPATGQAAKPATAPAPASAAAPAVAPAAPSALNPVLTPYLKIQTALAADKTEGVAEAAPELARAAEAAGLAPVAEAARKLTGADIKADREAFKGVSEPLAAAVLKDPAARDAFTVVHCSMAPGTWVQKGNDIRNPYYGAEMLECGDIKKAQ